MFSSRIRGGTAFSAQQQISGFKKLLFKSKKINQTSSTKRLDAKKIIRKTKIILTVLRIQNMVIHQMNTAKNTVISLNYAEAVPFHKISTP